MKAPLKKLHAYALLMRFDKPIGTYLLLWPTLWAIWIAGAGNPSAKVLLLFTCGVVVMRAAGCVINDFADRNIDGHIQRTRNRPLVTGAVTAKEALWLFSILCLLAFAIVIQFELKVVLLACVAVVLATVYPFLKRSMSIPQVFLGLAWYLGLPMAFAALLGYVPVIAWLMYLTVTVWAVAYDTIYAIIDREDDLRLGVKSTAILFAKNDILIITCLHLCVILLLLALGLILSMGMFYYFAVLMALGLAVYQIYLIRNREAESCMRAFRNNHWYGAIIFAGIVLNYYFSYAQ